MEDAQLIVVLIALTTFLNSLKEEIRQTKTEKQKFQDSEKLPGRLDRFFSG